MPNGPSEPLPNMLSDDDEVSTNPPAQASGGIDPPDFRSRSDHGQVDSPDTHGPVTWVWRHRAMLVACAGVVLAIVAVLNSLVREFVSGTSHASIQTPT
jgi:hypothetical protein